MTRRVAIRPRAERRDVPTARRLACALLAPLAAGCAALYERYGHGRIVDADPNVPEQALVVELPANAPSISQRYRPTPWYEIGGEVMGPHEGVDMFVPSGHPVIAPAPGTVTDAGSSVMFGRTLTIDHGRDADGMPIRTRYFHLSEREVAVGERVERGQRIARSGMSGVQGGFPHLHFEVRRYSTSEPSYDLGPLNPQRFWVDGVGKVTCFDPGRDFPARPLRFTYPVSCSASD